MAKANPEPTPEPTAAPTAAPTPEPIFHEEGEWSWSLEGGVLIIRGTGNMADYDYGKERPWEAQKEEITRVVIEDGITGIGNWAFYNCDGMSTVEIPQSVTTIGDHAFYHCDNMSTIEIPQSVTTIGDGVFGFCHNLVAIEVDSGNPNYKSVDGVLFSGDGTTMICCPAGKERTEYTIPDSVTTIGVGSFVGCERLKSVEIPPSVQTIESQAFHYCGIETIRIPSSLTLMAFAPFPYCESLRYIEVDSGNPSYKSVDGVLYTKDGASLIRYPAKSDRTAYTIPEGVTTICAYAFYRCKSLRSIEIPESVQCIDWEAFGGCENLRSIKIPEGVTSIDKWAFDHCDRLTDLYYGGTKAQWEALVGETKLGLPEGVTIHFES